jgi:hypothetical protein
MEKQEVENVLMKTDRLDDDSVVVNFDVEDEEGEVVGQSGYVHIRQEDDQFVVTIFNAEGDVMCEINTTYEVKEC